MSAEKRKRKIWTREETLGFLKFYNARKDEFVHARKKKHAYEHVLEDMISEKITDSSMTPKMLENKMQTLMSAYKSAKDNNKQTGASPCFAPFMEKMDKIFGDSAHISNGHTVQIGFNSDSTSEQFLEEPPNKKRRNYKEEYYKKKLEMKKAYMDQKSKILEDMATNFGDNLQKRNDLEEQKVALLKSYVTQKINK